MPTTSPSLIEELRHHLLRAQKHLVEAQRRRSAKDTPANRTAVDECVAAIDTILDMFLDIEDFCRYESA